MALGRDVSTAVKVVAITPADGADLALACDGLIIGTGGALKIDCLDGTTTTIPGIPAGVWYIGAKRVYATGTVAANISAIYFRS